MRRPVMLLAAAVLAAASTSATASPPPPVEVGNGGCGSGYSSVVNVNTVHVCRRAYNPHAYVSSTPCPGGYGEVGAGEVGKYVCYRL